MTGKIKIFPLDFRNDQSVTQKTTIDIFFQNNNVESWELDNNLEDAIVGYEDTQPNPNPTRFAIFDVDADLGIESIQGHEDEINTHQAVVNFASINRVIKFAMLYDKKIAIQYVTR